MTQLSVQCPLNLDLAFVERVRHSLETAFGVGFEIWFRDDQWNRVPVDSLDQHGALDEHVEAPLTQLLNDAQTQDKPRCQVTDGRKARLAIPLSGPRRMKLVATAAFHDVPPGFLVRFAQMFTSGFGDQQQLTTLLKKRMRFCAR